MKGLLWAVLLLTVGLILAPSPAVVCGRLDKATCDQAVEMARRQFPDHSKATAVVADYDCPLGAYCHVGFGALVAFLVHDDGWKAPTWPPTFFVSEPRRH